MSSRHNPARDPDLCVITGVLANRAQCPGIPYTPAEIGEEARRANEVVAEQLCRATGRKPATLEQVREILGLGAAS